MTHLQTKQVVQSLFREAVENPAKLNDIQEVLDMQEHLLNEGYLKTELYTAGGLWKAGAENVARVKRLLNDWMVAQQNMVDLY